PASFQIRPANPAWTEYRASWPPGRRQRATRAVPRTTWRAASTLHDALECSQARGPHGLGDLSAVGSLLRDPTRVNAPYRPYAALPRSKIDTSHAITRLEQICK